MFLIFDIIGIFAFSLSGFLSAKKKKLDIFGIFLISYVTALGGGFIRDISLNKTPFIFEANYPLVVVLLSIIIGYLIRDHLSRLEQLKSFLIADSIGLISFSINGALIAQSYNLNLTSFIFLPLFSAIGGGIIRDILLKRKITIFNEDIYGSISIIIGLIFYFFPNINSTLIFLIFLIIRLFIITKKMSLPKI
jgi:uncharacterized membrane protein YeiH